MGASHAEGGWYAVISATTRLLQTNSKGNMLHLTFYSSHSFSTSIFNYFHLDWTLEVEWTIGCFPGCYHEFSEECKGKVTLQLAAKFEALPKYTQNSKLYFHNILLERFLFAIFLSILTRRFYDEHSKPMFVIFNINLSLLLILQLSIWVYIIWVSYASSAVATP